MDVHLDEEAGAEGSAAGGPEPALSIRRNGRSQKTVTTDSRQGGFLDIPRRPQSAPSDHALLIAKYQRRRGTYSRKFDRKIVSMYARGMDHPRRAIQGHI